MKFLKITTFFLTFAALTSFTVHKFYVSITRVEFVEEQQSLQIITQIFLDDLEKSLSERHGKKVHLASQKETEKDVALYENYIQNKFKVIVNGDPVTYSIIGHKYDIDQVKTYIEISDVKSLETIEIENKILMDAFETQQNIVHVKLDDKRRSLVLDNENPKGLLNFE